MSVLIIAEAGVNHNGNIDIAKELVDVAASCGANYIKFQTFKASSLLTKNTPKAQYQIEKKKKNETQYEMIKKLELSESMHTEIFKYCKRKHIGFLSTGFDIESVNFLYKLGCSLIKIPSGEIDNLPLLRHIGSLGCETILSSGMATLGEIEKAILTLEISGTSRKKITVLHCTTDYPTSLNDVNLLAMVNISKAFNVKVGYSDHTEGLCVPIAATALKAKVIEKHFTLNKSLPGPDHQASLEPNELRMMIQEIRNTEKAMGDGIKRPTTNELKNKLVIRKSIVTSCPIKKGEKFSENNLTTKRPGNGMSPMLWDNLIGQVSKRDYFEDELIEL